MRSTSTRAVMCGLLSAMFFVAALGFATSRATSKERGEPLQAPVTKPYRGPDGKELFVREWIPGDPRSHSGDGLGPVFNDSSCVGCHNQGGPGGGGPASKNVHIFTGPILRSGKRQAIQMQSFVLHHFGTDPGYAQWRATKTKSATLVRGNLPVNSNEQQIVREVLIQRSGRFLLGNQISQRNTPALFGLGLIDAIQERTLEEAAAKKYPEFPKVSGRVARKSNGRVGRLGWKAQKASLDDFVLTACAVELGLHVPGHEQPPKPHKPDYTSSGPDMTTAECDALVAYVRSLPAPIQQKPLHAKHAEFLKAGKQVFTAVGCAACHTPKLGDVAGIYSDLLLHDMGPGLSDVGSSYGVLRPGSPSNNPKQPKTPEPKGDDIAKRPTKKPAVVAAAQEWRTPPLWGVRDSAPYLHDGRAKTLEQAIAFHAGEATDSTKKFNALSAQEKQKLIAFLKSLVAPLPSGS